MPRENDAGAVNAENATTPLGLAVEQFATCFHGAQIAAQPNPSSSGPRNQSSMADPASWDVTMRSSEPTCSKLVDRRMFVGSRPEFMLRCRVVQGS